ncbi:efflux RND transporter permease subunit [Thermogutta sp.]|uniref:efflux RND transporter permease subunit n=1 Tax=Thermogutta sp. TaxID=1962930 RepID=UPI003C7DD972
MEPRLLRIPGVAQVKIVGGRQPEYHVVVDTAKLEARRLSLQEVVDALEKTNQLLPTGMHEENRQLYLAVLDNRVRRPEELGNVVLAWTEHGPVYLREVAEIKPGEAPQFNVVTADGRPAVLMNIYSQPNNASTTRIADALHEELNRIRRDYPSDLHLPSSTINRCLLRKGSGACGRQLLLDWLSRWLFFSCSCAIYGRQLWQWQSFRQRF